jgi:uncharacterized protein
MSQVPHLYQLQKMDTELEQISQRLNEISKIIQNDQTLQLAEKTLSQSRASLHRAHIELRSSEERVSEQRIKIETSESNLYGGKIKNPKELQDLQLEIA